MQRLQISKGNSKLGNIPSVSLPPVTTCPDNVPCSRLCYARKSYRRFPAVKAGRDGNWELWRQSPRCFESMLFEFLGRTKAARFRFHVSGDFPDKAYINMVARAAIAFPGTAFYAYTKAFHLFTPDIVEMVRNVRNFNVLASEWVESDGRVSWPIPAHIRKAFPIATIDQGQPITGDVVHCPGSCVYCQQCAVVDRGTIVFPLH